MSERGTERAGRAAQPARASLMKMRSNVPATCGLMTGVKMGGSRGPVGKGGLLASSQLPQNLDTTLEKSVLVGEPRTDLRFSFYHQVNGVSTEIKPSFKNSKEIKFGIHEFVN